MFDLSNLNDYEFEMLCRDIMQIILDTKLFTFSRGIDAGIDICDKSTPPQIIIQVKHYVNSSYSNLKASLIKEVKKVDAQKPENYYVCTSLSLSLKNKSEIMNMFPNYIHDISQILDKNDINSFLEEHQNTDLVFKNYKLWLCASNVLALMNNHNVFLDCAELLSDIESQTKLFVETKAYRDSLKKLNDDKIIMIIGAPGVGKSIVSKMLLLNYASKKYIVRYVSNNDIAEVKKSLSPDPNKKEIVLLDDFLGQHYMNLKDKQPNELKTLISFVEKSMHKKLILNSRITILNEAMQTFPTFRDIMDKCEINKYLLDLDKMSIFEKAKILYNHIYFNSLPTDYFATIKLNKNYFKIIKHKNYNPRIIDFATKKRNYGSVKSSEYLNYIINKLNNPEDVWKDEFRNRLNPIDRVLMNTLYSLSDTMIDNSALEKAFCRRISAQPNNDTSINQYEDTINRLTDSLLKNIDDHGKKKISTVNPSINDYLRSELSSNLNEQISIIDNAFYFEQILKVLLSDEAKRYFTNKLICEDLLKIETLENSSSFYFIKCIVEFGIFEKVLIKKVRFALESAYINLNNKSEDEYGKLICAIYTEKYRYFYILHNSFFDRDKIYLILKPMLPDDAIKLIELMAREYDLSNNDDLTCVFKDILIEKINDMVLEELSEDLSDVVDRVLRNVDYDYISSSDIEYAVWSKLEDSAYERVEELISMIDSQIALAIDEFNIGEMRDYLDISDAIRLNLEYYERDPYEYYDGGMDKSDDSLIESLFER